MSEYIITTNDELYHYGVKGMRWGVRRAKRHNRLGDRYRGKAYGTGSYANGNYKPPKDTSESAFTKNITKSDTHYKKAETTMQKTYEKASKKLDKLDTRTDKALEKARAKRAKADRKMDSMFSTTKGIAKAERKAQKAMRKAVKVANKGRKWTKAMEKTFADTNIQMTKEQVEIGRKFVEVMDKRTFR